MARGPQTLHASLHGLGGAGVFVSLAAAALVAGWRALHETGGRSWAAYSLLSGLVVAAFFVAHLTTASLDAAGRLPDSPTGLLQRVAIFAGWLWVAALGVRLAR